MTLMPPPPGTSDGTVARTVDHLAAGVHQAVDSLSGATTRTAETLEVRGKQLLDAQSRLTARCCAQVRERPFASVGIAAAGGLLLGWLLHRR